MRIFFYFIFQIEKSNTRMHNKQIHGPESYVMSCSVSGDQRSLVAQLKFKCKNIQGGKILYYWGEVESESNYLFYCTNCDYRI